MATSILRLAYIHPVALNRDEPRLRFYLDSKTIAVVWHVT